MITVFNSHALHKQLVYRALYEGRTGSRVPSAEAAAQALHADQSTFISSFSLCSTVDIVSEVFSVEPALAQYRNIDIVILRPDDKEQPTLTGSLVIPSRDVIVRADDISSALSVLAFDGHRALSGVAFYDDVTRSVSVVNKELTDVRGVFEAITSDVARMVVDAASASYAHLVSYMAAHEKSEALVGIDNQVVSPRVIVDGLNTYNLEQLERDIDDKIVRSVDSVSLRYALFVVALREGLLSGSLKVESQHLSTKIDIGRGYHSAMFFLGIRDAWGNEVVEVEVRAPEFDYERPCVCLETCVVSGYSDKRDLGLAWLKSTYGDRLLAAFEHNTFEAGVSDAQLRSRAWDIIDARALTVLRSLATNLEMLRVSVQSQQQALSDAVRALQRTTSVVF